MSNYKRKTGDTRTLQGKVAYVIRERPWLAGDTIGLTNVIWGSFWGHLFTPPLTSVEEISRAGTMSGRMISVDLAQRLPSPESVAACAAKVEVPEIPYYAR